MKNFLSTTKQFLTISPSILLVILRQKFAHITARGGEERGRGALPWRFRFVLNERIQSVKVCQPNKLLGRHLEERQLCLINLAKRNRNEKRTKQTLDYTKLIKKSCDCNFVLMCCLLNCNCEASRVDPVIATIECKSCQLVIITYNTQPNTYPCPKPGG